MPRRPRVFVNGALYHLYCRTSRGEKVFADPAEADRFVTTAHEVLRRDGCTVLAWCLMPTHYHLALRTGRLPLWRTMRLIQGRVALDHNRRARVLGPLWQSRYKAKLIEDEASLLRVIAYVHLNPVAAGLVDDPADYATSGHRELLRAVSSSLVDADAALALFGPTRRAARRAYLALLRGHRHAAWLADEPVRAPWWSGRQPDEPLDLPATPPGLDALGASTAPPHAPVAALRLFEASAALLGLETQAMRGRSKGPPMTKARELLVLTGVESFGSRITDLAQQLAMNPGSVGRVLARATARRHDDPAFARRASRFETALIKAIDGQPPNRSRR
jgi:REP element-mobilizing transposase RayT